MIDIFDVYVFEPTSAFYRRKRSYSGNPLGDFFFPKGDINVYPRGM